MGGIQADSPTTVKRDQPLGEKIRCFVGTPKCLKLRSQILRTLQGLLANKSPK